MRRLQRHGKRWHAEPNRARAVNTVGGGVERHADDPGAQRFSLIVGGPFSALLGRCGLLGPDRLPTPFAALLLGALAWLVPGGCALLQGMFDPAYDGTRYFEDASAVARLFIAITVMVGTERYADRRVLQIASEFWQQRLVVGEARARFFELLRAADRQSGSALLQCMFLLAVFIGAGRAVGFTLHIEKTGWEGALLANGDVALSWAGTAARYFSLPLFEFLVLLWFWRLGVWSLLLYRVSRLPLQLTPLHADRCAGLGFVGLFPGVFRGLVFALSCVVASLLWKDVAAGDGAGNLEFLRNVAALWVLVVLVVFVSPLLAFYQPLYSLREAELTNIGRVTNTWYRHHHGRLVEGGVKRADEDLCDADVPSISELNAAIETLRSIQAVPLDRAALVQLLGAALAPLGVAAATQMPLRQLMGSVLGFMI